MLKSFKLQQCVEESLEDENSRDDKDVPIEGM